MSDGYPGRQAIPCILADSTVWAQLDEAHPHWVVAALAGRIFRFGLKLVDPEGGFSFQKNISQF